MAKSIEMPPHVGSYSKHEAKARSQTISSAGNLKHLQAPA